MVIGGHGGESLMGGGGRASTAGNPALNGQAPGSGGGGVYNSRRQRRRKAPPASSCWSIEMSTPAVHSWKPSAARMLSITGFGPRPRGAFPATPPGCAAAWPAKDPADVLDYVYDITPAFWGDDGDSIAFLDVTITPAAAGDLTLASSTSNGSARHPLARAPGRAARLMP